MNLDELCLEIVKSNIIKKAQEDKPIGDATSNQAQFRLPDSQPAGSNTAPTAAQAPAVPTPAKPKTPKPLDQKDEESDKEEDAENKQTNQPPGANQPQEANKISSTLHSLVSLAIQENINKYSETTIYYMNPKTKEKILKRLGGRVAVIKFVNSNDKFPAIIDEDTYDHYVKAGLETIYVPLSKTESFFTIKAQNANEKDLLNTFSNIHKKGYLSEFKCAKKAEGIYITCSLDEYQDVNELSDIIMEEIIDISGTFEIPLENRLCIIPECINSNNEVIVL